MKMKRSKPDIQIRIAIADDASSIASILYQSFIEYKSSYTAEGFAATTPKDEQVQSRLMEGPAWVALCDDAIAGTASAVPKGESLYIRGMAVLPNARGHSLGELILKQIESYAVEKNYRRLFLSTTPFLSHAIALYERNGFRRNSEGPDDLFGTPLLTMEKALETSD